MREKDKKMIEENMDSINIIIKKLVGKFGISYTEADEYRQTGYLALCTAVCKYNGSTKFSTFANKVITNAFIDKYRRDKARKIDSVSLDNVYAEDDNGNEASLINYLATDNNTENEVLTRTTNDLIIKYIKNTKDKCSAKTTVKGFDALELNLRGYSGEEIANMFNVPSNSVRSWMSRAKKCLKENREFMELIRNY